MRVYGDYVCQTHQKLKEHALFGLYFAKLRLKAEQYLKSEHPCLWALLMI